MKKPYKLLIVPVGVVGETIQRDLPHADLLKYLDEMFKDLHKTYPDAIFKLDSDIMSTSLIVHIIIGGTNTHTIVCIPGRAQ